MSHRPTARWQTHRGPEASAPVEARSLRWLAVILLAVLLTAMLPASSSAQSAEIRPERCATPEVSSLEMEMVESRLREWEMTAPQARASDPLEDIDVYFHVVHSGREGRISRNAVRRQIEVMNEAFEAYGLRFQLQRIDYRNRDRWFRGCADPSIQERMKRKLSRNPETEGKVLDVYSCGTWYLGEATFPWYHDAQSAQHGIIVRYTTLPEGSEPHYDLGYTAVHEAGHWLGLYHTFQSYGTCDNGDQVSDTARERDPAYGCPIGRDSCPGASGVDPIDNFMNYTDDSCMERFTERQADRMRRTHRAYTSESGS